MTHEPSTQELLSRVKQGEPDAGDQLFHRVYDELHALAERYFRRQPDSHTLQPTALVHEAYLKLVGRAASYADGAHFRAVAAKAMQHVLIDHAKRKETEKHGKGVVHVMLDEGLVSADDREVDLSGLGQALSQLAELDERKWHVVVLRFFGGLTIEETAQFLGIARSTVAEDWRMARAWLASELREDTPDARTDS